MRNILEWRIGLELNSLRFEIRAAGALFHDPDCMRANLYQPHDRDSVDFFICGTKMEPFEPSNALVGKHIDEIFGNAEPTAGADR